MNNKRLFTLLSLYLSGLLLSVAVPAVESLPPSALEGEFVEDVDALIKQIAKGNYVYTVAFSPDGNTLASGAVGTIQLWDVRTGIGIQKIEGNYRLALSVAFSPDGNILASGSSDKTVRLWDINTGTELKRLDGHSDWVRSVALSPDGHILASGSSDNTVRLWDINTGTELKRFDGHSGSVWSVAFSPDGSTLASDPSDNTVRLWDVKTGTELKRFYGHSSSVLSVAFSPDGNVLASGSWDKTVRLWDVKTGTELRQLDGHSGSVLSVAFSPEGSTLASGSRDKTVRLWNVNTGTELRRFDGHSNYVDSVDFSPNSHILASGSWDGTVRLWNVQNGQLQRILVGGRNGTWLSCDGQNHCLRSRDFPIKINTQSIPPPNSRTKEQNEKTSSPSLSSNDRNLGGQPKSNDRDLEEQPKSTEVPPILLLPENEASNEQGQVSWQLSLDSPETLEFLNAGENQALNLKVVVPVSNISKHTPIKLIIEELSLKTTEKPSLLVKLTNAGQQDLKDSVFKLSLDEAPLGTAITRKRIKAGETVILQCNLDNATTIANNPPSTSEDTIPSVLKSLSLSKWYQYIVWLVLTFIVLSIVMYYLYHHPIVENLATGANLRSLPLPLLPKTRLLLRVTRRLNRVLLDSAVHVTLLNEAIWFLKKSPSTQATLLANRLGAKCEAIPSNPPLKQTDLFRLHLHESFPLNLKSFLLYLPATRVPVAYILNQLQQRDEMALQKVVIILLHDTQLQALRSYGKDASNLWIVPNHVELTEWLLAPDPIQAFAGVLARQLKMTQISPYQTRGGVNKDTIFFGRTQILDRILNRTPTNYLIVGGRQLGKSSLLKHIHRYYHNHSQVQCHYLPLQGDNLPGELATEFGLPSDSDLDKVLTQLLKVAPGQRRLVLIDEADLFIRAEMERGYPILRRFRSVSEEGHCHFILAGFWELYQASESDYQSPLKNFGEPIPIAELEIEACRDLAIKPMQALNLFYSSEILVNELLTKTGQRANLIAIVCSEMLKELPNQQRFLFQKDMRRAFNSKAMHDALKGWQVPSNESELPNDESANRLDRMIVYTTIQQGEFKLLELRKLLQKHGCTYSVEQVKQSLERLVLSFVIKRESQGRYVYCVPLFRDMLLEENVDELLQWELDVLYSPPL